MIPSEIYHKLKSMRTSEMVGCGLKGLAGFTCSRPVRWAVCGCLVVGAVWFAYELLDARERREFVETAERMGGEVLYEHEFVGLGIQMEYRSGVPMPGNPLLRRVLGDDWFRVPREVILRGKHITDESVRSLARFDDLNVVVILNGTSVTEHGREEFLAAAPNSILIGP